jgi:hypothetical protein
MSPESFPNPQTATMSSPSSAYEGSPAKVSVILDKPSDWNEWMFLVKQRAQLVEVWQYANPELEEAPTKPKRPQRPEPSDVKPEALTIGELTDQERQTLLIFRDDYKIQEKEYQLLTKGLRELDNMICTTISRTNLTFILRNCDTPYAKLKALQKRLAPTDRARELELIRKYNEIKKLPRTQGVDKWLQQWEKTYTDAECIHLPDVQGDRPLYNFLQAVNGLDPHFALTKMAVIMREKDKPSLFNLIEQFRNTRRILQASRSTYL